MVVPSSWGSAVIFPSPGPLSCLPLCPRGTLSLLPPPWMETRKTLNWRLPLADPGNKYTLWTNTRPLSQYLFYDTRVCVCVCVCVHSITVNLHNVYVQCHMIQYWPTLYDCIHVHMDSPVYVHVRVHVCMYMYLNVVYLHNMCGSRNKWSNDTGILNKTLNVNILYKYHVPYPWIFIQSPMNPTGHICLYTW